MVFAIHWHESAMDIHVFPTLIPPPTSLSTCSLWVFPVHQPRALVSCIQPGLVICFTLDDIHVSMLFPHNIPPSPSPTESKSLFCTSVFLLVSSFPVTSLFISENFIIFIFLPRLSSIFFTSFSIIRQTLTILDLPHLSKRDNHFFSLSSEALLITEILTAVSEGKWTKRAWLPSLRALCPLGYSTTSLGTNTHAGISHKSMAPFV